MKRDIEIELNLPGLHFWKDAGQFEEVEYLQHPHRHIFCFQLAFYVTHGDRDLEFIITRNAVEEYLRENYWSDQYKLLNFKGMSCEMIAEDLKEAFDASKVRVGEDKEFFGGIK